MKKKEMIIFICEDDKIGREIIGKYLKSGEVTYAEFLPVEERPKIISFLKELEND